MRAKSFLEKITENIDERSGFRDDVKMVKFPKKFWIVEKPGPDSEIEDVFYESNMLDFHLQTRGGLEWNKIQGFYTDKKTAEKAAKSAMRLMDIVKKNLKF